MSDGIEAAELSARAHLQSLQDELGHEHPELEAPIEKLAALASAQGKWVVARAFMRRLVHLRVLLYGAGHSLVATTRGMLEDLEDVENVENVENEPSSDSRWASPIALHG